jgi:hypothetical protein
MASYHSPLYPGPFVPRPEPGLSESMLIEVVGGHTSTGSVRLEVTAVVLSYGALVVEATVHYPNSNEGGSADVGSPFAVLTTPGGLQGEYEVGQPEGRLPA